MWDFIKALLKGMSWTLLTLFFGLLQLWLLLFSRLLHKTIPLIQDSMIMDGLFFFFATSIVTALAVDYFLKPKPKLPIPIIGLIFCLFPAVIIILSVWQFGQCYGKQITDINFVLLSQIEYAVMVMTLVYSTFIKTVIYSNK
jgi:hypothetical protein